MASALAVCAGTAAARAEDEATFVLRAGRVYTMAEGDAWVIDDGMIFVRDGRVAAVGRNLEVPSFVDEIHLPDAVVMPGLIAADSFLAGRHNAEDTVGAQYRAADAFDAFADHRRVLAGGVTTVYLNPGRHRLVSGVGAVAKIGAAPDAALLESGAGLVINLGESAFNPPAKQHWLVPPSSDLRIDPSDVQRPTSRLGQLLQLNESFDAALKYHAARTRRVRRTDEQRPAFDAGLDALADLLRRKVMIRVHADRAADLEQAVRFCRDRGHDFILSGAIQSDRLARELAAVGAPIIYEIPMDPSADSQDIGPDPDRLDDRLTIPPALHELTLAVAGPPQAPVGELMFYAAAAERAGLPKRRAIEAITSAAAKIFGLAGSVGSIQPGRDADLVVLNGEPLAATTHVRRVYVNGRLRFDATGLAGDQLVIRAGRIWTGEKWITHGAVLIEDGRIVSVGETTPHPPYAHVVDAGPSAVLTPGFIDARGHLGLEGDRSPAGAELSIAEALYRAGPDFLRVARSGVTTVFTSGYRPGKSGSRVSAIHTAGAHREELVVRETAGLIFSFRGQDPETVSEALRKSLEAGRKYDEAWKKYEKALAEYKAKGPKKAPEEKEKKDVEEIVIEKPEEDPVTGTWEGEFSGGPLPEPQGFVMKLKRTGDEVEGSIESILGGGEAVGLNGTYQDNHLTLEFDVDTPFGKPTIEADIDRPDHLIGELKLGPRFSFDLEADRTEKEVPEIKISRRRRKKGKNGRPEAPKRDEALEPYRDLFAGRIPLVIDLDSRQLLDALLPVFKDVIKVPFVLLNAEEAGPAAEALIESQTGVILPPRTVRTVNRRDYVQSVDMSRRGVPLAFQSDAEDGARHLPDRASYAVRRGMDATAALRALTGDAARLLRCEEEVGFLKPGCRGDVLIFDGPPLEPGTKLRRVFINGKEVHP